MSFYDDSFIDELRKELPPIFTRETASKMIGGIFSVKTLSNFDSAGKGPTKVVHIGRKRAYYKEDFLLWLQGMIKLTNKRTRYMSNPYWQ